jgi:ADP-ribosylglycohydrolase
MNALQRAQRSLDGLSVGDAFGELFFYISPEYATLNDLPGEMWRWTDDTHMALSIVEVLKNFGRVDQDALAQAFARRYLDEPNRGYGSGAKRLLARIATGAAWREESPLLFGSGSCGNGAAMRVAPLGAFFADDPSRAAAEARLSAVVTHAHPEGQAGAMAVAVAAALASGTPRPAGRDFIEAVAGYVPEGLTRRGLQHALEVPPGALALAARLLGTGNQVTAQDTVPFCVWIAAHHPDSFEDALWETVRGLGDRDTTCAIVGGIVSLSAPEIPAEWLRRREPLPQT